MSIICKDAGRIRLTEMDAPIDVDNAERESGLGSRSSDSGGERSGGSGVEDARSSSPWSSSNSYESGPDLSGVFKFSSGPYAWHNFVIYSS